MNWRKNQLRNSKLYIILDTQICKNRILKITEEIIEGGADIIQLRPKGLTDKELLLLASSLKRKIKKRLFIVNNRPDIARAVDADGVHLGQDDMAPEFARKILGNNKIIGKSCHSLNQLKKSLRENLDYISIGPLYKTLTKPEYKPIGLNLVAKSKSITKLPIFPIGGINLKNLKYVVAIGVNKIAVCSAVLKSLDVLRATERFKEALINIK